MNKLLSTIALSAALLIPSCVAAAQDEHRNEHKRYYDKRHNDYHEFDEHENRAWQIYAQRQHRDIAFERANERQQQQYWNWRHNHSDAILQINIR